MIDEALSSLSQGLANGKLLTAEHWFTKIAQRSNKIQQGILSDLKSIGESGRLASIISAEKIIVKFDLKEYANSKNMASSLAIAQKELEAIETNIGLVCDPKRYKEIDLSHVQPKVRDSRDLPLDSARIAFRSHNARLVNYDKTKSDDHEKAIIQARLQNIRIAENLYIERQEKALGREGAQVEQPPMTTINKEQLEKITSQFFADAQEQGIDPKALAVFQDALRKTLDKQVGKLSSGKSAISKKPKDKNKNVPKIER
jgi:hypothetical protein